MGQELQFSKSCHAWAFMTPSSPGYLSDCSFTGSFWWVSSASLLVGTPCSSISVPPLSFYSLSLCDFICRRAFLYWCLNCSLFSGSVSLQPSLKPCPVLTFPSPILNWSWTWPKQSSWSCPEAPFLYHCSLPPCYSRLILTNQPSPMTHASRSYQFFLHNISKIWTFFSAHMVWPPNKLKFVQDNLAKAFRCYCNIKT